MRVIQSKFTKQTRKFLQNGRGGARCAGPGSAFVYNAFSNSYMDCKMYSYRKKLEIMLTQMFLLFLIIKHKG